MDVSAEPDGEENRRAQGDQEEIGKERDPVTDQTNEPQETEVTG